MREWLPKKRGHQLPFPPVFKNCPYSGRHLLQVATHDIAQVLNQQCHRALVEIQPTVDRLPGSCKARRSATALSRLPDKQQASRCQILFIGAAESKRMRVC
jgi:hypothetical protein